MTQGLTICKGTIKAKLPFISLTKQKLNIFKAKTFNTVSYKEVSMFQPRQFYHNQNSNPGQNCKLGDDC